MDWVAGVPPLLALLGTGDAGVLQDAAAALRNLAASSDAAAAAIAGIAGGMTALLRLLDNASVDVRAGGAGTLHALARRSSTHAALLESGAVARLDAVAAADEAAAVRAEARGAVALLLLLPTPATGAESQLSSPSSTNAGSTQ